MSDSREDLELSHRGTLAPCDFTTVWRLLWSFSLQKRREQAPNITFTCQIEGDVDVTTIETILRAWIARCETLQIEPCSIRHEVSPIVRLEPTLTFAYQDLRQAHHEEQNLSKLLEKELGELHDHVIGRMLRIKLVQIEQAQFTLFLTMPRLLSDELAIEVLLLEMQKNYPDNMYKMELTDHSLQLSDKEDAPEQN